MESIKIYMFYNEPSKEEIINLRNIFLNYNFRDDHSGNTFPEYRIYYLHDKTTLNIYSINILTNTELLEELFPYFLNMTPIFERNIDHLLQLQ